jgi:hypothetical protein
MNPKPRQHAARPGRAAVVIALVGGLIAVEAVTYFTGGVDLGTGVAVFAAFDLLVSVGLVVYALGPVLLRRGDRDELFEYRLSRRLNEVLPGVAATAVRTDVLALRAVVLQLLRRHPQALPRRGESEITPFGYARGLIPMFVAIGVGDLGFVVVLLVALPDGPWKTASHVLAAIGLLWVVGFAASLVAYRHAVADGAARLRFAGMYDAVVEWDGEARIVREERSWDGGKSGQLRGDALVFPVMNRTNVRVDLPAATSTRSLNRHLDGAEVRRLYFCTDDEARIPRADP